MWKPRPDRIVAVTEMKTDLRVYVQKKPFDPGVLLEHFDWDERARLATPNRAPKVQEPGS